jgi:hypothetical protein
MRTNMKRAFGLCIALCLGLTLACVRVDVSTPLSGTHRPSTPPLLHEEPPPSISIEKLRELHGRPPSPPSFSHSINAEKQQTAAWCWAASTRMVMEYHNEKEKKPTNLQCNTVNKIFWGRLDGTNCCQIRGTSDFVDAPTSDFIDVSLKCVRGGWPHWVFDAYRYKYKTVARALDWETLKREVSSKGPFIPVIEWREGGRHAYIVMGYSTARSNGATNLSPSQQYVRIYDPSPTTIEKNFSEGDYSDIPIEEYMGDSPETPGNHYGYFHHLDYVQISPKSEDQR